MSDEITHDRRRFLGTAATTIAAVHLGTIALQKAQLPFEAQFPSLGHATGWLNSPPLTADGLRGKVVLVEFWTYSCINWLRPFLTSGRGLGNTGIKVW